LIITDKFHGKKVSVLGIGISNTPLVEFLLEHGAVVTARDMKTMDRLPEKVRAFRERGVEFILGEKYLDNIDADYIFRAPGIRYDKPGIADAVAKGAELTSEMELFFELCPAKIIGITGSDGKTTTTTVISEIIRKKFGRVFVGGNIGRPLLPEVASMTDKDFAVVELSSFQLHTMKRSPDIAVITNVAPNHLDYHTDMNEYIDAKKNIFLHQSADSLLVLNARNEITAAMAGEAIGRVRMFCGEPSADGVYEKDGAVWHGGKKIMKTSDILIPGHHNVENYMAVTAALADIVDPADIADTAASFPGVEHRIELVRELDGVKYYNSSIDSSPTRTTAALNSFKQKVIAICGGYDKHIPFEPLAEPVCRSVKKLILTGATAEKIKNAVISSKYYKENCPEIIEEPDFEKAVIAARNASVPGDVVILTPACASFDAFPNFEIRGRKFKDIVKSF